MASTYVITGTSRGIGLAFVKHLSSKGNTVFALARNPDASEGLQELVDNQRVFPIKFDAVDESSIKNAVEEITKAAPEGIDYLINNAAISGEKTNTVLNSSGEEYIKVFNTNVVAVSNATHAFLPLLRKRGQEKTKKILNISSILGSIAIVNELSPEGNVSAYSVSKCALNMLTRMFANVLAKENIIIYAAHPGWVKTEMGGAGAMVEPKDSVAGLLKVLHGTTAEKSGSFTDYEGNQLSW